MLKAVLWVWCIKTLQKYVITFNFWLDQLIKRDVLITKLNIIFRHKMPEKCILHLWGLNMLYICSKLYFRNF